VLTTKTIPFLLATGLLLVVPWAARAADEEIQVYEDDLSAKGESGVDVHNNFVLSGRATPAYPGEQPPLHVYRLTPEFYYGLTDSLELGLYLLSTHASDGATHMDGEKVRIKYVAPHDHEDGFYWGANLEVGRTQRLVSETPWNAQLKGILGYRYGHWTFVANPNVDWSLSAGGGAAGLSLDMRVAYAVTKETQLAVESYNQLGPVSSLGPLNAYEKQVFAVVDHEFAHFDISAGLGRGYAGDADRYTLKLIVGKHF
jgi:hypothetical protein